MKKDANAVIHAQNISKCFMTDQGELKVLQDISLSIYNEEIVALVGPSGSGKTTLINIISGLISADQGELIFDRKSKTAYVFQEPRLLPWKTVDANIDFVQQNFLPRQKAKLVRERLLDKTGLLAYKNAYPSQLSGGMKQRVEIVRALSVQPDLLFMDEVFKSLDIALKYQLYELLLEEHARESFAILFVTHDPEEAVMLADRVLILSRKPMRIRREIIIDIPREQRSLRNRKIYNKLEEILDLIL